jgi:hypothetical protein
LEKIEHGHHVFRAYWKNTSNTKSSPPFCEVCSNNLRDFGLKKGLEHLAEVRRTCLGVLDRFATLQTSALNVHVEFPSFSAVPNPCTRERPAFLHGGTTAGGRTTAALHQAVLSSYALSPDRYPLSQLRHDLRKLRAHGLLERPGHRYAYRRTPKGVKTALLFTLFHQRIWRTASFITGRTRRPGPKANSRPLTTKRMPPFNRSLTWCKLHEPC